MCPATANLPSCKVHAVIHFLHTVNVSVEEIHLYIHMTVYGQKGNERRNCNNDVEYSDMNEQMFAAKSEVVGPL
jgi:hypothetical protein